MLFKDLILAHLTQVYFMQQPLQQIKCFSSHYEYTWAS